MSMPRRRWAVVSLTVAAVLLLAGCASEPEPTAAAPAGPTPSPSATVDQYGQVALPAGKPGTPPVALPRAEQVNGNDPSAVAAAALRITWSMDTTIDTSQHQASLRAAPFLDPAYLAGLRQLTPRAAPGAEWITWAKHRAYTVVSLTPAYDDQPPDTATEARRRWGLTLTPVGRDGWKGPPTTITVFATLTRPGPRAPWRLSGVHVSS
jgi:hypothetical protein